MHFILASPSPFPIFPHFLNSPHKFPQLLNLPHISPSAPNLPAFPPFLNPLSRAYIYIICCGRYILNLGWTWVQFTTKSDAKIWVLPIPYKFLTCFFRFFAVLLQNKQKKGKIDEENGTFLNKKGEGKGAALNEK